MPKVKKRQEKTEKTIQRIKSKLWERDCYELVAEKSAELGNAALKVLRADRYSENRIELPAELAHEEFKEKTIELLMAMQVLGFNLEHLVYETSLSDKWSVWYEQMQCC